MNSNRLSAVVLSSVAGLACLAMGQDVGQGVGLPEPAPLPKFATAEELAWMAANPVGAPKGFGSAPVGPLVCPGEYAPSDGILFAWQGGTTLNNIQRRMIRAITTTGNARAYIAFPDAGTRSTVMASLTTNALSIGTDVSRVVPMVGATNAIWIRDYGPRYVYEGRVRVISDHDYNVTSRTLDNAFPTLFAPFMKQARYVLPLRHGGGNYHLNSIGEGFATQLIGNENPTRTTAQIQALWLQHWGVNTTITPAFPTSVDATQHIDMWVQILGDRLVMVSDWPSNVGSTQDVICDNRAAAFAAAGWTVVRLPARSLGGTHYTYTNMVACNDLALVPTYTNATMVQYNAGVLAAYQAALPGKVVVGIDCDSLAVLAGVMHCIVMHVPKHLGEAGSFGGLAPTVHLCSLRGPGVVVAAGSGQQVRWISDDDAPWTSAATGSLGAAGEGGVQSVDVELSRDNGATWTFVSGGQGTANDGAHLWVVPSGPGSYTEYARLRVTAVDALGNRGTDLSEPFVIDGEACTGDIGRQGGLPGPDGLRDNNDFVAFLDLFFAADSRADLGVQGGGLGSDGLLNNNDYVAFVDAFFGGC